jgi:hypothetical protein
MSELHSQDYVSGRASMFEGCGRFESDFDWLTIVGIASGAIAEWQLEPAVTDFEIHSGTSPACLKMGTLNYSVHLYKSAII